VFCKAKKSYSQAEILEALNAEEKRHYRMAEAGVIEPTEAGARSVGIFGVAAALGLQDEYINGKGEGGQDESASPR
jgi:hypothetical protein